MKRSLSFFVGSALLASTAILPLAALAQSNQAMMPTLYNQSGTAVNTGTASVPAGTYYLQTGGLHPVQYFGNGTYYDPAIGQYGGSISDPNGTSGAGLGYVTGTSGVFAANPGVPNTGAGGNASNTWALLIASGVIVLVGAAALTYTFSRQKMA